MNEKTYKANIIKEFSNVNNISVYYRQGHLNFDLSTDSSISIDECKKAVKKTKEFIEKEGIINLLPKGYGEQQTIMTNLKWVKVYESRRIIYVSVYQ